MSKGSDPAKAAEWRDRFERFKKSEVKLEAFCESEGVTKANFYAWRHKLGLTKPRRRGAAKGGAFQQKIDIPSDPAGREALLEQLANTINEQAEKN